MFSEFCFVFSFYSFQIRFRYNFYFPIPLTAYSRLSQLRTFARNICSINKAYIIIRRQFLSF